MELKHLFITARVSLVGLVVGIGDKLWHLIKPGIRRVYIFFAKPNVLYFYKDEPYLRKGKSEAEQLIENFRSKLVKRRN